jgi:hypothetical protein
MQQQYQYGDYILPHHHQSHSTFISAPTMAHQSMINVHSNQSSYYTHNNNNYAGQVNLFIFWNFKERKSLYLG